MNIYLYDGTFLSLLTLIASLFKLNIEPNDIKSKDNYIPNLLNVAKEIKFACDNILEFMIKVYSLDIINSIYYVFLSTEKDKEMIIYDFLKQAIKLKKKVFYYRNIDSVDKVLKIRKRVLGEAHKLKGFLRFKKMKNNFYYAEINPTNDCLEIVANHFKKRLKNEIWIIKDVNREKYVIYDLHNIYYLSSENIKSLNINYSIEEASVEELWKSFFATVAIKTRENKKCQMNFMPKKYWKYIIEMEDET